MHATSSGKIFTTDLCAGYTRVRSHTEFLCNPLETEDYIPQPNVDVSPARWNIAHTTWFFEEMILRRHLEGYQPFDENFNYLFNSYYNTIGERTARHDRGAMSRPTVSRIFEYRAYVDEHMSQLLTGPVDEAVSQLVILGLNHEQQHQELLLSDLKYTFGLNPIFPAYKEDFAPEEAPEPEAAQWIKVPAGIYEIGYAGSGFCFDNELARHKQWLDDVSISPRLVTNSEFQAFMDDGGYTDHRLWHSEGWDWVKENNIASPLHWRKKVDGWHIFTLGGLRQLQPGSPVCHVSYYEAAAFAEWQGLRLPTEFEWEAASDILDWGKRWEWTNSAYLPYPGFRKAAGAVGEYNGKFMINQMVLRGASVATPAGHSRPTYRNFFHPHLRWQFTGIRLAR